MKSARAIRGAVWLKPAVGFRWWLGASTAWTAPLSPRNSRSVCKKFTFGLQDCLGPRLASP